ncbi:MAG: hypothetical protein P1U34_12510 [Coxiellaceae bacterium]|nr:hypothetical protein [Coxiellaceae bacterium]
MNKYAKNTIKHTVGSFMFFRAANEPTWTASFNVIAMDSLMLTGSLLVMNANPFNKDMMHDSTFDLLWKSAVTMVLGMGAGMLSYEIIKGGISLCSAQSHEDSQAYNQFDDAASPPLPPSPV